MRLLLLVPDGVGVRNFLLGPCGKAIRQSCDVRILTGFGKELLPAEWREKADLLVSLSRLTMPHELARAVLAEQIYRALTMLRGHPYPR